MMSAKPDPSGAPRGRSGLLGKMLVSGAFAASCLGLVCCAVPALAQAPAQIQDAGPQAPAAPAPVAESAPPSPVAAPPSSVGETPAPAETVEHKADEAKPAPRAEALSPSSLPQDLTPKGMFLNAVMTVKIVMIGLAFASLATWTVWLAKTIELWSAKRAAQRGLEILSQAANLRAAEKAFAQERSPVALFVAAAVGESERSAGLPAEGVKERVAALLSRIEARAGRNMTRATGVLATIGSTAPFVGLFGTVWGIMDSFIGISQSHTTNLAVVAPGIAEALLATAMGLIAAIPAVVIYNVFARAIAGYRALLGDGAAEVLRMLSRDVDRAALPGRDEAIVIPMRQSAE